MNPETTQNIINILLTMASASLIPIATGVGAFVVQKLKMQALNIKGDIFEKTQLAVKTAIFSAEQGGKSGKLATNGNKKAHAIKLATKLLEKQKIRVDPDILSELVESNVWESLQVVIDTPKAVTPPSKPEEELEEQVKSEEKPDFKGVVIESVG